jgi:hypothetical protein
MRILMPVDWSSFAQLAFIACAWIIGVLAVLLVAPEIRRTLCGFALGLAGKTASAQRVGMSG